jgi:DNA-binding SARP family transcriptional activator/predicted ATPase
MELRVTLLGAFRIVADGHMVSEIRQSRQHALLAYLMLHPEHPHARQELAFRFWPDSSERQAHANLRYLLHQLRQGFPPITQYLRIDVRTVHWQPSAPVQIDVLAFEAHVAAAQAAPPDAARASLEQAAALYHGSLLPSCVDEWIFPIREQLDQSFLNVLERLIELHSRAGDVRAAIRVAVRLLQHDPLREVSYARLMRLHILHGDRASALRVYHDCAALLDAELGVGPGPDVQQAYAEALALGEPPVAQARPVAAPSPPQLIGRASEMAHMQGALREALAGRPSLVLITGEAGIGKTRLAEELLAVGRQRGITTARTRAYPTSAQLAYAPLVELLRSGLYRNRLAELDSETHAEVARLMPEVRHERPALPQPPGINSSWERRRLFEALARVVLLDDQPLVLLFDDLQWADSESLEWLRYLPRFAPDARLLVVGTVRVDEVAADHPLTALQLDLQRTGQLAQISLAPLTSAATEALACQIADAPLDRATLGRIYEQTEGTPLFVVEVVRAGLYSRAAEPQQETQAVEMRIGGSEQPLPIPPGMLAVLRHRLGQLSPPARALVEIAAVVGRSFAVDVIARAGDLPEGELIYALDELWQRRIVREHGLQGYDFSHDRLREVAYADIGPARRRLLHRRVAEALEALLPPAHYDASAQIALHYARAGMVDNAVPAYRRAAQVAQAVFAHKEAIGHLRAALVLLEQLPPGAMRDQEEFQIQLALAVSHRVQDGWTAEETAQALRRAQFLAADRADQKIQLQLGFGLLGYHIVRGEIAEAHTLAERLVALADEAQNSALQTAAYNGLAGALLHQGELLRSEQLFSRVVSSYSRRHHHDYVAMVGLDYGVLGMAWHSHCLWLLGDAERALAQGRAALSLAEELDHPFSRTLALTYLATLHQLRGERAQVAAVSEQAIALANAHDIRYYGAWAVVLLQWSRVEAGAGETVRRQLRSALDAFCATTAGLRQPYFLALLAEAHAEAGETDVALQLLDEASQVASAQGERWWDAEICRLRGNCLLARRQDDPAAEAQLLRALTIARSQSARALERRAALSLAGLYERLGRHEQARALRAGPAPHTGDDGR